MEAEEDLHAGVRAKPFQVYDIENDDELQSAIDKAKENFLDEEDFHVDSDSKDQEELTEQKADLDFDGLEVRFRDAPPVDAIPSGSGRWQPPCPGLWGN